MTTEPANNETIRFMLEGFARQQLIVDAAQEELEIIEAEIVAAFGDRKDGLFSDNAHVAYERGRRNLDWQAGAMRADVPPEKYKLYAKPAKIDWKKMCKNEGVLEESVPFKRGPSTVKISLIKSKKQGE